MSAGPLSGTRDRAGLSGLAIIGFLLQAWALATGPIALVQPILVLKLGFGEKVRTGGWLAGADFGAVLIVGCTGLLAWSPLNDERGRVGDLDKGAGDREIRQRVSSSDPVRYPPAP